MAARRRPSVKRRPPGDHAFLNVPYDAKYEELLLAFFAGLSGFSLVPHATLEIPGSQRRLDRIVHLLRPNALVRRRRQPTAEELDEIYRDVRGFAVEFKRRFRPGSLFEARAFRDLGVAARRSARGRVASWRREERRRSQPA